MPALHTRSAGFGLLLALVALTAPLPGCAPAEPTPPPSVLLIVADTLRADHLGCYGYGRNTSPNLDALAERGVIFDDVVSQSSWTLPSMISLMTGRYVFASLPTMPPARATLAEVLRGAGYQTAAFVGNDVVGREEGFPRGFDHFVVGAELLEGLDAADDLLHSDSGGILVERVLGWAADNLQSPYFLYVHFIDPHLPYITPPGYTDFDDDLDPIPPAVREQYARSVAARPTLEPGLKKELAKIRRAHRAYDGEVAYMDARIGELLAGLDELGAMGDTLVAFTADHGEVIYERLDGLPDEADQARSQTSLTALYRNGHGEQLFDELIRVPLIVSGPGLLAGRRVEDTVASIDLLPTLLHLTDVTDRGERDGRNLAALLRDAEATAPPRQVLYSFCEQMTAAINPRRRLKYVRHNTAPGVPAGTHWMFDLGADPLELHDLMPAGRPQHLQAAEFLAQRLAERERKAVGDLAGAGYLEATQAKMRAMGYIK